MMVTIFCFFDNLTSSSLKKHVVGQTEKNDFNLGWSSILFVLANPNVFLSLNK